MNNEIPTLFMDTTPDGSTMLVLLVDPYTRTYWHGYMSRSTFYVQNKELRQRIAGLRTIYFEPSTDAEYTLATAFNMFCMDFTSGRSLDEYASYLKRSRKAIAATGMRAVMWQSGSRLFNDTFVVNTETGDYWNGNLITTALKELSMTLTGAKRSRRFQSYLENYPILLKGRFGERHVTVLKDETGALTRFYAETDRFTRKLKLKEIDNKAEKMTLAEFLERYDIKEDKQ